MARRRITLGTGGGIAAGAPFALAGALFVQQVGPPVAFTQRLACIVDSSQSIVAPGKIAGVGSFVVGRNVVDNAGAHQILVGDSLSIASAANQSDYVTLLGYGIAVPGGVGSNNSGITAVGSNLGFVVATGHNSFSGAIVIGNGVSLQCKTTTDGINSIVMGTSAICQGSDSVVLGSLAQGNDDNSISLGRQATSNGQSIAIGSGTQAGPDEVVIGANGAKGGTTCIAIGWNTQLTGCTDSIGLGVGIDLHTTPKNNWFQVGSTGHPINTIAWSNGHLDIVAGALVYTGGLGTATVLAPA